MYSDPHDLFNYGYPQPNDGYKLSRPTKYFAWSEFHSINPLATPHQYIEWCKDNHYLVYFRGVQLQGVDFSNLDLRFAVFSESQLDSTNFSNCVLNSAIFNYSSLCNANFYAAKLRSAEFINADLSDANLANTIALFADFSKANMKGVILDGAELKASSWSWCVYD